MEVLLCADIDRVDLVGHLRLVVGAHWSIRHRQPPIAKRNRLFLYGAARIGQRVIIGGRVGADAFVGTVGAIWRVGVVGVARETALYAFRGGNLGDGIAADVGLGNDKLGQLQLVDERRRALLKRNTSQVVSP